MSKREERSRAVRGACAREWRAKPRGKLEKMRAGQRLVFTRQPEYVYDRRGDVIGVDAWVELYDQHGNEVPIDPHRRIVNPPTVPRAGVRVLPNPDDPDRPGRELTTDPAAAFFEAVWDSVADVPNPAGWRTRGTVTTVFADASDGYLQSLGDNYVDVQQGLGSGGFVVTTASTAHTIGQSFGSGTYRIYETYLSFDTAAIADSDVVTNVSLQTYLTLDNSTLADFTVMVQQLNWGATLTSADWFDPTFFGTNLASLDTSGIGSTGAYKTFTAQAAFLSVTNLKTGTVYLNLASSRSIEDTPPPGTGTEYIQIAATDTAGTTQDPKLVITHNSNIIGGSVSTVNVTATGGGTTVRQGGAEATVNVLAGGGGGAPMALAATYLGDLSRVRVEATSLDNLTATLLIERSTNGLQWTTVRGAVALAVSDNTARVDDYEFPSGVPETYRVTGRDALGNTVEVGTVSITATITQVWLKSIEWPFLNRPVVVTEWGDIQRPARGGTFDVVGRSFPVAVTDKRGSRRCTLELVTHTSEQARDMDFMLASGGPVFVHVPADCPVPGMYAVIGDTSEKRAARRSVRRLFSLPLTEVAAPGPDVVGNTAVWETVLLPYDDWNHFIVFYPTWNDVLDVIANPETVIVP